MTQGLVTAGSAAAASGTGRRIRQPIILVGFARSGTTLLGRLVRAHPDVTVLVEPRTVWMTGNAYHPHDALGPEQLTPRIADRIDRKFAALLAESGRTRLAEKTPSNCLRLGFVHALYPDCKVVHILRDGRDSVRSLLQAQNRAPNTRPRLLRRMRETPLLEWPANLPLLVRTVIGTQLLGRRRGSFWGPRPPGWRDWIGLPPHVRAARQWRACVEAALRDGRRLPPGSYLEFRYEELVQDPVAWTRRILEFTGLPEDASVLEHAASYVEKGRAERWRSTLSAGQEAEMLAELEPQLSGLGYR